MNLFKLFNLFHVINYFISFHQQMIVLKDSSHIKIEWILIL